MDLEKIKGALRSRLLSSTSLKATIGSRVYPSELALVSSPIFPCIAMQFTSTPLELPASVANSALMLNCTLWIYSSPEGGITLCYNIFRQVQELLNCHSIVTESAVVSCTMATAPLDAYDPDAQVSYLSNNWRLFAGMLS